MNPESKIAVSSLFLVTCLLMSPAIYNIVTSPAYYLDTAPDGWYHQRSYITNFSIYNNGTEIFFPVCDHDYLGPLHGFFRVADGVVFGEGRSDIKIINNIIVEAHKYD